MRATKPLTNLSICWPATTILWPRLRNGADRAAIERRSPPDTDGWPPIDPSFPGAAITQHGISFGIDAVEDGIKVLFYHGRAVA